MANCLAPSARPYSAAAALIVPSRAPAAGLGAARKGEKLTLVVAPSPLPAPTPDGPPPAPHQVLVALPTPHAPRTAIPQHALLSPRAVIGCACNVIVVRLGARAAKPAEPNAENRTGVDRIADDVGIDHHTRAPL